MYVLSLGRIIILKIGDRRLWRDSDDAVRVRGCDGGGAGAVAIPVAVSALKEGEQWDQERADGRDGWGQEKRDHQIQVSLSVMVHCQFI